MATQTERLELRLPLPLAERMRDAMRRAGITSKNEFAVRAISEKLERELARKEK